MYIGEITEILDYDKWIVKVKNETKARKLPIGSFLVVSNSKVGVLVGNLQKIPEDYIGKEGDFESDSGIFLNRTDEEEAYFKVLGVGEKGSSEFGINHPPGLREDVFRMEKEEVVDFHNKGGVSFSYYSDIVDFEKIELDIVYKILENLETIFSNKEVLNTLDALKRYTRRKK
ncbi:MAG: hypothetical protein BTN85_0509 [Candidatus Methanohalarchaeum thermophilum]|uniref:Uncharacterized protein n=1 Tax=Methanohalarchaeum thermophilum TaxID=1903181 RepID=A0A1Q6DUI0_METT1|nr:MAG: hypothetical protein BTN85_0509 [Candidatus Methanohalarchaeum thermophilum]